MTSPTLSDLATQCFAASGLIDGVEDVAALQPTHRLLEEGDVLCSLGDPADCLWVLFRGKLAVKRDGATIVCRQAGAVLGEQGLLLRHGRRSADLVACEGPVEVLRVSKAAIESHPAVAQIWKNCATILSAKLEEATAQRRELGDDARTARTALRTHVGDQALSDAQLYPEVSLGRHFRTLRCVILFSDVEGFSRYTAAMVPDRAAQLVQQFLTPQFDAIRIANGLVDKFMGDGIMAFWPVDGAPAEVCAAALAAAEGAAAGVAEVPIGNERVRIRVGLHLGEVCAGNFGTVTRRQYTLIGSDVNKAARIEQHKANSEDKGDALGLIRASAEFFAALPPAVGSSRLPRTTTITPKNIAPFVVHSSKGE
jgi:class 3 adenylate cyclase